ncbi:MAG: DUF1064 domain-containing protein [Bacteroidaceae bacterium]|jgi:hypothetical protein|nr:DUF1064 domain-containing protein [Bacteroidaceae bacterium]
MSKYHSKKVVVDGISFDSRKEANRYRELKLLERAGKITELKRQIKYILIPSQRIDGKVVERPCAYVADFVYKKDGEVIVEDTKGFKTKEYVIKRKLMLHVYGIRIKEV